MQGFLFGSLLCLAATPKWSPLHFLIPEQNAMAVAALVAWGMAGAFLLAKLKLLQREQAAERQSDLKGLVIDASSDVDGMIDLADRAGSLLGKRLSWLLQIWKDTGSPFQLERALDTDKELYEHSVQSSYLLARVLVWAIPIFGFVGTVGGISHAVGAFDAVLNAAENVDALRDGLVEVTGGLSKAFHTTSLGLVLSVIVMLPLTYLEKTEQELLASVDTELRAKVLAITPPEGFSDVEEASISRLVADAFERHLPDPSVLVEPAKIYAERLTDGTLARLDPLRSLAKESIEGIAEARLSIQDQAQDVKRELDGLGANLVQAIGAMQPVIKELSRATTLAASVSNGLDDQQELIALRQSVQSLQVLLEDFSAGVEEVVDRQDPEAISLWGHLRQALSRLNR